MSEGPSAYGGGTEHEGAGAVQGGPMTVSPPLSPETLYSGEHESAFANGAADDAATGTLLTRATRRDRRHTSVKARELVAVRRKRAAESQPDQGADPSGCAPSWHAAEPAALKTRATPSAVSKYRERSPQDVPGRATG